MNERLERLLKKLKLTSANRKTTIEQELEWDSNPESDLYNPYSDPDRFRMEAFKRIPGVVNINRTEEETTVRNNDE